ncbi:citryl-CoA lyase [Jannaschia aquimarina]|uniref:citrate synthase (unknown stereospecificity) n=1 Tax=Jannaschia aquimarina TaxID=935700 RepID=A0A0D1DAZ9_9RHOB|nr:citryl-CoA lyase [Jannaschia aquimarina]KIT17118.1 2-methylcitrate synthase [Jannaschia aquimarina]SNS47235.1 citrate synthase [Jannaschia aquimarina]
MSREIDPVADWWRTAIIDMEPGRIDLRGRPIEESIGTERFPAMIWRLVTGGDLGGARLDLFEAALVAAVDHGPQAPSIAAARMAATCGVGLQSAMATGIGMLGDVHGGAGEQALDLYTHVIAEGAGPALDALAARGVRYVPGFGHRFHPVDPRAPALLGLVDAAEARGAVDGRHAGAGRAVEAELARRKGRLIPMNIDGATAVIYGELGCPPPLARGFFVLSRSVGILAHAWEQTRQGGRNKGPTPPGHRWTYDPDEGA